MSPRTISSGTNTSSSTTSLKWWEPLRNRIGLIVIPGADRSTMSFAAEGEQSGRSLAIGHPVGGERCARGQQLLGHDEPVDRCPPMAAVLGRDRHTDPASLCELPREVG